MSEGGSTEDPAKTLLEEVRSDPVGWNWMDLDKLLALNGFAEKKISEGQAGEATYRYMVEHPNLNVVLSHDDKVHSRIANHVVSIIDRARERAAR